MKLFGRVKTKTADTASDRRPDWLKATDGLGITYVVEHEFNGKNRQERRARRFGPRQPQQSMATALGLRQDKAAVARKAYQAGCHGKSVAPRSADELLARYGSRPTLAQARRIRKARNAEVSA